MTGSAHTPGEVEHGVHISQSKKVGSLFRIWPLMADCSEAEVKWGDVGVPYLQGNHLSIHVVSLGSVCPYRFHFSLRGPWELRAGQQQGAFAEQLLA